MNLSRLRVVEQSVPAIGSNQFKGLEGDKKLDIFSVLKINGMAGALRTKSKVVYDEVRE